MSHTLTLQEVTKSLFDESLIPEKYFSELGTQRVYTLTSGSKIGYVLLNAHLVGLRPAIIAVGASFSDMSTPERGWEAVQLASLGRPVMLIDLPGHGQTSRNPLRTTFDLCFKRTTRSQAEPLLEAVHAVVGTNERIDYFGISHGAHLALKMAELTSVSSEQAVMLIDLPAIKKRNSFLLILKLLFESRFGRHKYINALKNTKPAQQYHSFEAQFKLLKIKRARSVVLSDPVFFILNFFSSINASPGSIDILNNIARSHSNTFISIATSELGNISDPKAINNCIAELSNQEKARIKHRVLPSENHNIAMYYLIPRAVSWAKKVYSK